MILRCRILCQIKQRMNDTMMPTANERHSGCAGCISFYVHVKVTMSYCVTLYQVQKIKRIYCLCYLTLSFQICPLQIPDTMTKRTARLYGPMVFVKWLVDVSCVTSEVLPPTRLSNMTVIY